MQQGIIRIMAQYADGSPIELEGILSKWRNDCGVVAREKCKIFGPGMMLQKKCKKHYGDSSNNIIFSLLTEKKLAKML
jgi:hypothetical protein